MSKELTIGEWAASTPATFETKPALVRELEARIEELCELANHLRVPLLVATRVADDKLADITTVHLACRDAGRLPVEFLLAQACVTTRGTEFAEQFNGLWRLEQERQERRNRMH